MQKNRASSSVTVTKYGFTLVELVVVVGIIALLCAVLFPAFAIVRSNGRRAVCQSNLRQIGQSMFMYMQDADGFYPFALDAEDVQHSVLWKFDAGFYASMPKMLLLHDALRPYAKSSEIFHCPSDTGYTKSDYDGLDIDATPTSYWKFHSSYIYRTELAQRHLTEGAIVTPIEINVLTDAVGIWHGSNFPSVLRYNVLFADGHVKNLDRDQVDDLWTFPIEARSSASF